MNQAVYTLTHSLKMVQTSFPHHNYMNSIYKLTANACAMCAHECSSFQKLTFLQLLHYNTRFQPPNDTTMAIAPATDTVPLKLPIIR